MSEVFFTADTHFGHGNIVKYAGRPFTNSHEMDKAIIERWNAVVKPEDTVYHLGDVGFRAPAHLLGILRQLNGTIHLVTGNHDKVALKCGYKFASISPLTEVRIPDPDAPQALQGIVLCHYAMRTWNKSHWGTWHLFGHSHGRLQIPPESRSMDVGVDCSTPFGTPFSYDQIKEEMSKKTWKPPFAARDEEDV